MARQMKDSGIEWIGEIPACWELRPARYAFSEVKEKNTDGIETRALQFKFGKIIAKTNFNAEDDDYVADTITNYTIVEPGTVMINGLNLNYDFKTQRVALVAERGVITSAYLALRPDEQLIDAEYATYLFKGYESKMALHNMGAGIRLTLGFREFKNQPVLFPTLCEQRKIVAFLDRKGAEIDAVIERTKATIEEYKKLKQAVITEAVTKGVRGPRPMKDSGYDFIGAIPKEWEVCRLRSIGVPQNGISKGGEYFGQGFPFVSYGDVYKNYALPTSVAGLVESTDDERERYSVQCGDIFFTRTSETIEEVGFSSVCLQTIPDATFAGFLIRVRPFTDKLYPGYSKYYFRSSHHRAYLTKQMNLVTRASLGQDLLKSMPVLLPSIEEQKEIAFYIDEKCAALDNLIAKKTALLTELETYKKSLIYEYVTGKKEVTD
ncbi:MAG: restriction endonuclease subunit S [Clostridiales bacterium]|nr:restriction endonuclease subunit S [Clostridiales bacterium]